MANKDSIYNWWWSNSGPNKEGPLTVEEMEKLLTTARTSKQIAGLKDPLSYSGWNFAVLKFLIIYCIPISDNRSIFWSDLLNNKHELGNYGVWKKYLSEKIIINRPGVRYWKIAPGEDARFWDRCLAEKNISVGWSLIPDLKGHIGNQSDFEKFYLENDKSPNSGKKTHSMNQLWYFVNLKEGDLILANKGMHKISGIGKVISGYSYQNDYDEFKHTIGVDWFYPVMIEIPPEAYNLSDSWFGVTVKELSREDYDKLTGSPPIPKSHQGMQKIALLNKKKQIILYGPPGTGKTYTTKKLAIDLITLNSNKRDPED